MISCQSVSGNGVSGATRRMFARTWALIGAHTTPVPKYRSTRSRTSAKT